MADEPFLIAVPEAARLLGIGRSKAWMMVQRGEMPGVIRLGRSVRVSVARLREWWSARLTVRHADAGGKAL